MHAIDVLQRIRNTVKFWPSYFIVDIKKKKKKIIGHKIIFNIIFVECKL